VRAVVAAMLLCSASASFADVSLPTSSGAQATCAERLASARRRLQAIDPRLSRLRVEVTSFAQSNWRVELNGHFEDYSFLAAYVTWRLGEPGEWSVEKTDEHLNASRSFAVGGSVVNLYGLPAERMPRVWRVLREAIEDCERIYCSMIAPP
jgi:hypothetical protein